MEENNSTLLKPSTHTPTNNNYALNGKIMLCSVIILFAAVSIMICTHSYAGCLFRRRRRRRRRRVASHRLASLSATSASSGLDLSVLNALPTFVYVSDREGKGDNDDRSSLECSVCLSEFEDQEEGRVLPKCKHTFHLECIDMWFGSHSTCPLCRAPVEPLDSSGNATEVSGEVIVTVIEGVGSEPGKCDKEEAETRGFDFSTSSPSGSHETDCLDLEKKPAEVAGVIVEVPMDAMDRKGAGLVDLGLGLGSSGGHGSTKSPGNRVFTLERICSV